MLELQSDEYLLADKIGNSWLGRGSAQCSMRSGQGSAETMEATAVYLLQGFAIYVGQLHDNSLHRHPFVQLILGMGATFELECEAGPWGEPVALINSNQLHRVRTDSGRLVVLLIGPELRQSRALMRRYFSESEIVRPPPSLSLISGRPPVSALWFERVPRPSPAKGWLLPPVPGGAWFFRW